MKEVLVRVASHPRLPVLVPIGSVVVEKIESVMMNLDQLIQKGNERHEAEQRQRARAVHEAATEHVTVRINELHHLVGVTIAPALVEAGRREELEAEMLEAVSQARTKVESAYPAASDPVRRMSGLMMSSG